MLRPGVPLMLVLMVLPGAAGAEARRYGCLRRLGRLCRRCRSRPARAGRHCSVAARVLERRAGAFPSETMRVLVVPWSAVCGSGEA